MSSPSRARRSAWTVALATTALIVAGASTSATAAPPPAYPATGLNVSGVSISPTSDSASVGVCNPFTITLTTSSQGQTVTAQISQTTSDVQNDLVIGFCNPIGAQDSSTAAVEPSPDTSGPRKGSTTTTAPGSTNCTSPKPATPGATSNTASCEAAFLDSNNDKKIV